jgi:outer membrane lipoprotein
VAALRADPAAYLNRRVMVGGEILATIPRPGETELEILAKPLGPDDRPVRDDVSEGRVVVRSTQFLDPAVYAPARRLTVIGTVVGSDERKIGDLPYRYPVIGSERIYLWPREVVTPAYPPPPWFYYG